MWRDRFRREWNSCFFVPILGENGLVNLQFEAL